MTTGGQPAMRQVLIPKDDTWPKCCGEPMWFRGGGTNVFYCDHCGSTRAPKPEEVRRV